MKWLRLLSVALVSVVLPACGERDTGPGDVPRVDGGAELPDVPGLDAASIDAALDAAGLDAAGLDAAGLDAPLPEDAGMADAPLVSMPCTAMGACDPFDVSSCPTGESCRLGATGTECLPLFSTTARIGEPCTRSDGCEPGALCLNFASEGFTCHAICADGSIGSCGPGAACTGSLGDTCVKVCRPLAPRCDIYAQDCADPLLSCTLVTNGETGERYTGCRPPGVLTAGAMCGGDLGTCVEGLICVREMGISTCRGVCNPEAGGPSCTGPETCSGTTTSWGVRYCRVPG